METTMKDKIGMLATMFIAINMAGLVVADEGDTTNLYCVDTR